MNKGLDNNKVVFGFIKLNYVVYCTWKWSDRNSYQSNFRKESPTNNCRLSKAIYKITEVNLFDKDIILVPIKTNNNHWVEGIIEIEKKSIKIYNSRVRDNSEELEVLKQFVIELHQGNNTTINLNEWTIATTENIPQKKNRRMTIVYSYVHLQKK
ncbi:hypothetical protein K501DRAFT_266192 [Backusella circina FSU 941]|nr:hypothetical protein K501DRAFT_266192 [Backusella circina FSU 941]